MSNPYGGSPYGPGQHGGGQQPQQPNYAQQPGYQQAAPPQQAPGAFTCPKCRGTMRTYNRNGLQIEQCDNCRGIFLDFGELESLVRMEGSFQPAPPPQQHGNYGQGWGSHGGHHYRQSGFSRLFFST